MAGDDAIRLRLGREAYRSGDQKTSQTRPPSAAGRPDGMFSILHLRRLDGKVDPAQRVLA